MPITTPPPWVQDALFYQIFPDRFARGSASAPLPHLEPWGSPPTPHGFKGGDLWGVRERLPYLQNLGVSALYLTPIFSSASNHRYHTDDYFQVDPLLGGDDALRALLNDAHALGMKVVLDGVFNHCGRGFYPFHHLQECQEASPYQEWFEVHRFPVRAFNESRPPTYSAWWNLHALPKLNVKSPAVRAFIYKVAAHWLEFGIDGWRLDVPEEIPDKAFWRGFVKTCRAVNPEAYIVGEIWGSPRGWIKEGMFDAQMNYPQARALLAYIGQGNRDRAVMGDSGYGPIKAINAPAFADALRLHWKRLPEAFSHAQLGVLGSHDTPRIRTILNHDARLNLLHLAQMTLPGPPCIYYGDEIGLEGVREPFSRGCYPWGAVTAEGKDILKTLKSLTQLRAQSLPLRRGNLEVLSHGARAILLLRRHNDSTALIALNPFEQGEALTFDPAIIPQGLTPRFTQNLDEDALKPGALTLPPLSGGCWF